MARPDLTSVDDLYRYTVESLKTGDFQEAALITRQVLQQSPGNTDFLSICEQVLEQVPGQPFFSIILGEIFENAGEIEKAKSQYMSILQPKETGVHWVTAMQAMVRLGVLEEHRSHHWIFLACAPKTASTFLASVLREVSGRPLVNFVYANEDNERDLYPPAMVSYATVDSIISTHLLPTGPNIRLLKEYGVKPTVLTRNLFDTTVSIFDHLKKENDLGALIGPVTNTYHEMSDEDKLNYIIDFALPWYFKFYAGWKRMSVLHELNVHWLTYQEVVQDSADVVRNIGSFYGLDFDSEKISQAVDSVRGSSQSRFNQGVKGRGLKTLSSEKAMRICRYARYYPDIDFSGLGISRDCEHVT